jgi:hypothetical protein
MEATKVRKNTLKAKYLIFPIWLLDSCEIENFQNTVNRIFSYAVYRHSEKLTLGTLNRKIADASTYFGYKLTEHDHRTQFFVDKGEMLIDAKDKTRPDLITISIPADKAVEFLTNQKTELEAASLLAYCALRSVVGKQLFAKTSKTQVLSKMAGNRTRESQKVLPEWLQKYETRYYFEKIKFELEQNWGVEFYGLFVRGFYASFLLDQKVLVKTVETHRKAYLLKTHREGQWEARSQALQDINRPPLKVRETV